MKQGFITQGFALIGVILASAALMVGSLFVAKNALALNASVNCSTSTLNVSYDPNYNPDSLWVDWNSDGSMDVTDNSVQTNNNGFRSYTIPSGVTRANIALIGSGFVTLDSTGLGWSPCVQATPTPAPPPPPPPPSVTITDPKLGQVTPAACESGLVPTNFQWTRATASDGSQVTEQWLDLSREPYGWDQGPGHFVNVQVPPGQSNYSAVVGNPIGPLAAGATHYWRITNHIAGRWTASAQGSFNTPPCGPTSPPPAPGGLTQSGVLACTNVNNYYRPYLNWSQTPTTPAATGYELKLRVDGGGENVSNVGYVFSVQIDPPGLTPDYHYHWSIRAYNEFGQGPFSNELELYSPTCTAPPTPPPTQATPAKDLRIIDQSCATDSTLNIDFQWTIAKDGNFDLQYHDWDIDQTDPWKGQEVPLNQGDTGYVIRLDIPHDTPIYWRVNTHNTTDNKWYESEVKSFKTADCTSGAPPPPPPPPTPTPTPVPGIVKPVAFNATELSCNQAEGTWTIRFNWEPGRTTDGEIPQQQWLDLQFASEGDWTYYEHAGPFGGQAIRYEWSGIAPNTPHRWRVANLIRDEWYHSENEPTFTTGPCGTTATPTPIAIPTPPPPPPSCQASSPFGITDPNGTTNQSQPTFFWNQSQGAALYYLDLSQDPNFVSFYNVPVSPNSIVNEGPFAGNIYQAWPGTPQGWPQQLPEGQTYYWRVSAWSQCALDAAQNGQDPIPYLRFGGPISVKYQKTVTQRTIHPASLTHVNTGDQSIDPLFQGTIDVNFRWNPSDNSQPGDIQWLYLKYADDGKGNPTKDNSIPIGPFDRKLISAAIGGDGLNPGLTPDKDHSWTIDTFNPAISYVPGLAVPDTFRTITTGSTPPPPPPPEAKVPQQPNSTNPNGQTFDISKTTNIDFSWDGDPKGYATDWWLDVSKDSSFSQWWGCNAKGTSIGWINCDWLLFKDSVGGVDLIDNPDLPLLSSLENGTYSWRVTAVNSNESPPLFSAPSAIKNFSITGSSAGNPPPPPPPPPPPVSCTPSSPFVLVNPPDVADNNSPAFDWEQKDAVSWFFDFTDQAGRDSGKWWYVKVNTNHLSQLPSMYADRYDGVQAPQVLDPNKQYYWKVTALSGCTNDKYNSGDPTWVNYITTSNGSFDAWRPLKFTQAPTPTPTPTPAIKPAAPKGLLATPGCSNDNRTQVTFTWNDAPDVDGWFVDASLDGFKTYSNAPVGKSGSPRFLWDDQNMMTDKGSTFTAPNNGQTYQWRVWGYKGDVSNGTHSDDKPFVTTKNCVPRGPADLQQIALDDQACTQDNKLNVTFRWIYDKSGLIDSQWLDVSPDNSNFTPDQYFAASNPPDTATRVYTSGSGKNIPALDSGRTYFWRINAHFIGDDSNTWYTSAAPSFSTRNDCAATSQKDFTIKVTPTDPQNATINPGQQANYAIEINYSPGWTDLLTLSPNHGQTLPGQPTIHIGYSLGGSSNVGQPTTLVGLGLQTESSTIPGTYEVPIKACKFGDPNFCHNAPTILTVIQPDFQIEISKSQETVNPGTKATFSLFLNYFNYLNGWSEPVNLQLANGSSITSEPSLSIDYNLGGSSMVPPEITEVKMDILTTDATPQISYPFKVRACNQAGTICKETTESTLTVKQSPTDTGNYGNPNNDFSKSALFQYMVEQAPAYGISSSNQVPGSNPLRADLTFLYQLVVDKESGYNPNSTNYYCGDPPRKITTCYGLFQWSVPLEWHKQVTAAYSWVGALRNTKDKNDQYTNCGFEYWEVAAIHGGYGQDTWNKCLGVYH
ncbi:MAG: hypothetical protein Q8P89_03320 [bacterium]|nr:hypothetical protein [bacterium]